MRESFIFYGSFLNAIELLSDKSQLKLYKVLINFALKGEDFSSILSKKELAIFELIKPQILANNKRYEDGKKGAEYGEKGGRPKKEKTPVGFSEKTPVGFSEKTPNVNVNDNVNDNENVNVNVNENDNVIFFDEIKKTDPFTNDNIDNCISIYKDECKNLIPITFERKNREVIESLNNVLYEIDNDIGTFRTLCRKANDIVEICDRKIDFKMLLRNYIGILNGKLAKKVEFDITALNFDG